MGEKCEMADMESLSIHLDPKNPKINANTEPDLSNEDTTDNSNSPIQKNDLQSTSDPEKDSKDFNASKQQKGKFKIKQFKLFYKNNDFFYLYSLLILN